MLAGWLLSFLLVYAVDDQFAKKTTETRILINTKLSIFTNPRKFIHAEISTFTVVKLTC